jgi:hypothetical protein
MRRCRRTQKTGPALRSRFQSTDIPSRRTVRLNSAALNTILTPGPDTPIWSRSRLGLAAEPLHPCGLEAAGTKELFEIVEDSLIQAVQLGPLAELMGKCLAELNAFGRPIDSD